MADETALPGSGSAPPAFKPPKEMRAVETDGQFCVIRFSPCGRFLVAGTFDGQIRRWNVAGGEFQELAPLKGQHGFVQSLQFAPGGTWLYAADSWGQLACWPYAEEAPQPRWSVEHAHDGWIRSLAIGSDGQRLATAARDRLVRFWNAEDGALLQSFAGHEDEVFAVAIHPEGKAVASGDLHGAIKEWDVESGRCVRTFALEKMHLYERIQDVAGLWLMQFDADGKVLQCGGSEPASAGRAHGVPTIHYVNWETGQSERSWQIGDANDGYVHDFVHRPDGTLFAVTSGQPGRGRFIVHRSGEEKPAFDSTKYLNCHSLALHPDGKRLVIAGINRNNQGNGAVLDKDGGYIGNYSPLYEFDLDPAA